MIESLVVIAIFAVLIALLLPAVQAARAAARSIQGVDSLKQVSLTTHNFEGTHAVFPPGQMKISNSTMPRFRGLSQFVNMPPYIEQQPLYNQWNLSNPLTNTEGATANSATVLGALLCPADIIQQSPVANSTRWYAIASYGGNGGNQSHPPTNLSSDGMFHATGPAAPGFNQVRVAEVTDGLTNTLLFGEWNHFDPNDEHPGPDQLPPRLRPCESAGWGRQRHRVRVLRHAPGVFPRQPASRGRELRDGRWVGAVPQRS